MIMTLDLVNKQKFFFNIFKTYLIYFYFFKRIIQTFLQLSNVSKPSAAVAISRSFQVKLEIRKRKGFNMIRVVLPF